MLLVLSRWTEEEAGLEIAGRAGMEPETPKHMVIMIILNIIDSDL